MSAVQNGLLALVFMKFYIRKCGLDFGFGNMTRETPNESWRYRNG